MSEQGYEELVLLNRKIDDLLKVYSILKEENKNLKSLNESLVKEVQEREAEMKELEKKYDRLKLSGAILGERENANEAKRRINELMREVDKCIALLDR
jgi:hypothetical protein